MLPIPQNDINEFNKALLQSAIPESCHNHYRKWLRYFLDFCRKYPPPDSKSEQIRSNELSSVDVKNYLTYLAVQSRVASSTQNQAFNALLFLYRHVLKVDFGDQRDVPRAKKTKYMPGVLSRQEIDSILKCLEYPFDIVFNLLYGCGFRLFECLSLRVQNFNFEDGILTVHGKGDKDRSVPLPQKIMSALKGQLEVVSALHEKDLADGYSGVFLKDSLEKKYPSTAKEFICIHSEGGPSLA